MIRKTVIVLFWLAISVLSLANLSFAEDKNALVDNSGLVDIDTADPSGFLRLFSTVEPTLRLDNTNYRTWDIFSGGGGAPTYNNSLIFYDRKAEQPRMAIDAQGNIGIGTMSPNEQLEIANTANGGRFIVSDGGSSDRRVILMNAPTSTTEYGEISAYKYGAGGGGRNLIVNYYGGNVGIGTISPQDKLEVSSLAHTVLRISTQASNNNEPAVEFWSNLNHPNERNWRIGTSDAILGDFAIKQSDGQGKDPDTQGTTRFYIDLTGRVGIGTTSPQASLEVTKAYQPGIFLRDTSPPVWAGGSFNFITEQAAPGQKELYLAWQKNAPGNNSGIGRFYIRRKDALGKGLDWIAYYGNTNNVIINEWKDSAEPWGNFIVANGNVGIGTLTPVSTFHIKGTTDSVLTIDKDAPGERTLLNLRDNSGNSKFNLNLNPNNIPLFYDRVSGTWSFSIALNSGNVGIGELNPNTKLEVKGAITLQKSTTPANPTTNKAVLYLTDDQSLKIRFANGKEFVLASADRSAPQIDDINLNSSQNFQQGSPVTIRVDAIDADGDTMEYRYFVNGSQLQGWTTQNQISWNPPADNIGLNNIRVEVRTAHEDGPADEEECYIFRKGISPP